MALPEISFKDQMILMGLTLLTPTVGTASVTVDKIDNSQTVGNLLTTNGEVVASRGLAGLAIVAGLATVVKTVDVLSGGPARRRARRSIQQPSAHR